MNQILYKGYTFGGVGEDVTNKQYGEVTIHNPITDEDETYNPIGGENSEIFNTYKGSSRNIASSGYTTVIGVGNKDLGQGTGENFISGCYNINLGRMNNISGYSNFVDGPYNLITGADNKIEGDSFLVSGNENKAIKSTNGLGVANGIIGERNTIIGDYSGCFIAGSKNTIDTSSIGGGNRGHMTVTGLSNYLKDSDESLVTGSNNNVISSEYSLVAGYRNSITGCPYVFCCGHDNIISEGTSFLIGGSSFEIEHLTNSILCGRTSQFNIVHNSIINTENSSASQIYDSLMIGKIEVTSDVLRSVIFGKNIQVASSTDSFVAGTTQVNGSIDQTILLGYNNTSPKDANNEFTTSGEVFLKNTIIGTDNTISKMKNLILIGNNNNSINDSASYFTSIIIGFNNNNTSCKSFIYGESNITAQSANNTYLIGESNNISNGAVYTYVIGRSNTSTNGANNNIILGKENTVTNGVINSCTMGNNLYNNFTKSILLGHFNSYTSGQQIQDKLLILGNGTADNERSNCLEINQDGSQEIILQDKTLSGTLGIGKIKITQEYIQFESLKNNSNNTKETVEFTFEDLQSLKNIAPAQNINNTPFPQI